MSSSWCAYFEQCNTCFLAQAQEFSPKSMDSIQIEAGVLDRRQNFLFPNRTYSVDRVFVNPSYNLNLANSPHDLALLLLRRPFEFTSNGLTAPISLSSLNATQLTSLNVAGWGDASIEDWDMNDSF